MHPGLEDKLVIGTCHKRGTLDRTSPASSCWDKSSEVLTGTDWSQGLKLHKQYT